MGREKAKEMDDEKKRKKKGISGGVLSPLGRERGHEATHREHDPLSPLSPMSIIVVHVVE